MPQEGQYSALWARVPEAGISGRGRAQGALVAVSPGDIITDMTDHPVLYTHAGCADSAKVRDWLTERGIPFTERNVSGDLEAAKAIYATGTFGTPLLVVRDRKVIGFRSEAIDAAIFDEA